MKKIAIVLVILFGTYVGLGLAFCGAIGYFQPQDGGTTVLRTFDSDGVAYETVLRPLEDEEGRIWLLSGQWFRSWYNRALENPNIELLNNEKKVGYRAIPLDDQGEVDMVLQLRRKGVSKGRIYFQRALLLFAPVKILKLEAVS